MINKLGLLFGIVGLILSIVAGVLYFKNKKEMRDLIARGEISIAEIEHRSKITQDSILYEIAQRDSTIKDLTVSRQRAREDLNVSVLQGKQLAIALKKAKLDKDTIAYYASCDSLGEKVVVLEAQNQVYQQRVELLDSVYKKQFNSKDSLLLAKDKLNSELRSSLLGSKLKVQELEDQKRKVEIRLEKSKRTTRLVALVGIAAAGTVYLIGR